MESVKKEVAKLTPANEQEKAIVIKAKNCLDEGIKAIEVHQKAHKDCRQIGIRVGSCSSIMKTMSLLPTLMTKRESIKLNKRQSSFQKENEHHHQPQPRGKWSPVG